MAGGTELLWDPERCRLTLSMIPEHHVLCLRAHGLSPLELNLGAPNRRCGSQLGSALETWSGSILSNRACGQT